MSRDFKTEIIALLNEYRIMTIATNRPDGWPQATVVSYVNEGLVLYCILGRNSQKYHNIVRDPRVSVAVSSDYGPSLPLRFKGLSLAGRATISENRTQIDRVHATNVEPTPAIQGNGSTGPSHDRSIACDA